MPKLLYAAASPYAFRADPTSALEVLQDENNLLKATIADAKVAVAELESQLLAAGVPTPPPVTVPDIMPSQPEDFWSPALEVRSPGGRGVGSSETVRLQSAVKRAGAVRNLYTQRSHDT